MNCHRIQRIFKASLHFYLSTLTVLTRPCFLYVDRACALQCMAGRGPGASGLDGWLLGHSAPPGLLSSSTPRASFPEIIIGKTCV